MNRDQFIAAIRERQPEDLAEEYLAADTVAAFSDGAQYTQFKARVHCYIPNVESISIVGSGNWRFSLHPGKNLKEFDKRSDIDVAVISHDQFTKIWEELRQAHRRYWYTFKPGVKQKINRYAQDVYAGFVTPVWIPKPCALRYNFKITLNRLQDNSVGFRPVKMLFFKSLIEARDYYKRGFLLAKRKVENNGI